MRPSLRDRLIVLGTALALAALVAASWWYRFVGQGTRQPLDWYLYFYPTYAATYARLAHGIVPLWNPYQLCGIPWLATLQGGTFYPFHVLYMLLPLNVAAATLGLLHLELIALSTAAFARRLGLGRAAAIVAAMVFSLRGYVPFALAAPNYIEAATWLPVGACALVGLARDQGPRSVVVLALATALSFLAGYPQPTVYGVYMWGTLLVALLIQQGADVRGWMRASVAFGGALLLGAALSAVQMLPAVELTGLGTRAPGALAERALLPFGLSPALPIIGLESIAGSMFAFGMVSLALIAAASFTRERRVLAWWAVGLALVTAVLSLGRYTPFFDIYLALPALRWFRNPDRVLVVTNFAAAIAAAIGVETLAGASASGATPARRPWLAIGAASVALVWLCRLAYDGYAPVESLSSVVAFTCAAAVLLLAALALGPRRPRVVAAAIVLVLGAEVSSFPWISMRLPYDAEDLEGYTQADAHFRALNQFVGHQRVWRHGMGILSIGALKLATWYGVRTMNDYEPVNLQRQADYFNYLTEGRTVPERPPYLFSGDLPTLSPPPGTPGAGTRRRLLDVAAVQYFVVPLGALFAGDIAAFVRDAHLTRDPHDGHGFTIFANPYAMPRAFVTYRTRTAPASAEETLAAMSLERFDPIAESFVEGPSPFEMAADAPQRGAPASFLRDDETVVEVQAGAARAGLVVLADTYYPGWRATVDGTPAPIVRTNYLFRGVPVPAGTHRVRFEYRPWSVRAGALLTLAGLLAVIVLLRRARNAPAA